MSNDTTGIAIVTGASTGIGAVYADRLARRGHDLILVARNAQRLEENATKIRVATGRHVEVIVADLTDAAPVASLVKRIDTDVSISALINNAGISLPGGLLENEPETVEKLIALNITAPTLLSIAAAKAFIRRKKGTVVNIGSVTAFMPERFDGVYSGSKNYLVNLTLSLAEKTKEAGVRFQVVLPGPTQTEMWDRSGVPASVIPAEKIMDPGILVDAARLALWPHLANGHAAPRYRPDRSTTSDRLS